MVDQLNKVPASLEPIGILKLGKNELAIPVAPVWYKFFVTLSGLFSGGGSSGAGASAILDTIGNTIGGLLSRFGTGWQEFVATSANQIPVMNPNVPITLRSIGQLLNLIGNVRGAVLFRGAADWQVLNPVSGGYFQSQGPGADPIYVAGSNVATVDIGLVATGTTQGTALVLIRNWNKIVITAANTGVLLPSFGLGTGSVVFNEGANALKIYPPAGGQIDALAVNAPYSLPTLKTQQFFQVTATQWQSAQLG